MTEEMKKKLSGILEKTVEPISDLSIADLGVVQGIKFNALSERFTVYLDMQRMSLVTGTFFFVTGDIEMEEILSRAIKNAFPGYTVRYYYIRGNNNTHGNLRFM